MSFHNALGGVLVATNIVCYGLKLYEGASWKLDMATCVNTFQAGEVYHPLHTEGNSFLTKLSHYYDYTANKRKFESMDSKQRLEQGFIGYGCTQLLSLKYPLFPWPMITLDRNIRCYREWHLIFERFQKMYRA